VTFGQRTVDELRAADELPAGDVPRQRAGR
jgi:hypothetical protein